MNRITVRVVASLALLFGAGCANDDQTKADAAPADEGVQKDIGPANDNTYIVPDPSSQSVPIRTVPGSATVGRGGSHTYTIHIDPDAQGAQEFKIVYSSTTNLHNPITRVRVPDGAASFPLELKAKPSASNDEVRFTPVNGAGISQTYGVFTIRGN